MSTRTFSNLNPLYLAVNGIKVSGKFEHTTNSIFVDNSLVFDLL